MTTKRNRLADIESVADLVDDYRKRNHLSRNAAARYLILAGLAEEAKQGRFDDRKLRGEE